MGLTNPPLLPHTNLLPNLFTSLPQLPFTTNLPQLTNPTPLLTTQLPLITSPLPTTPLPFTTPLLLPTNPAPNTPSSPSLKRHLPHLLRRQDLLPPPKRLLPLRKPLRSKKA